MKKAWMSVAMIGLVSIAGCAGSQGKTPAEEAASAVGQGGLEVLGHAGETTAAVVQGIGDAATELTGGGGGVAKDVKDAAADFGKERKTEFMGNEVTIDPKQDKKIRMEF
jgi:hypothetical protein